MTRKLLLLGGGGHCKSIIDSILDSNEYSEIGIVEKHDHSKALILGIPVIGIDEDLEYLKSIGFTDAFVSLGSIGNTLNRRRLFKLILSLGFAVPNIIDKNAIVSKSTVFGKGIFIGKHALVNADSSLADCSIINSSATIEHDCAIGEFVHVSSGAVLGGNVLIGSDSHIGAGSIIRQQIRIGKNVMIGMGSIVLHDVPDNTVAYGNPCRIVRSV